MGLQHEVSDRLSFVCDCSGSYAGFIQIFHEGYRTCLGLCASVYGCIGRGICRTGSHFENLVMLHPQMPAAVAMTRKWGDWRTAVKECVEKHQCIRGNSLICWPALLLPTTSTTASGSSLPTTPFAITGENTAGTCDAARSTPKGEPQGP